MEDITPLEQLHIDLELILWNDSFGVYTTDEFERLYKSVVDEITILTYPS